MSTRRSLRWGDDALALAIAWSADEAPSLVAVETSGAAVVLPSGRPLLEVLTVADGHAVSTARLVQTAVGARSRYVSHREDEVPGGQRLVVVTQDDVSGLRGETTFVVPEGVPVVRASVRLRNDGTDPVVVLSTASFAAYLGRPDAGGADETGGWTLHRGAAEWLGEGRWSTEPPDAVRVPDLGQQLTGQDPRGVRRVVSTGTWSTGEHLPVAAAVASGASLAWAWQVEHNGAWRYELGEDTAGTYLALSGPTDADHQCLTVLRPGEELETVPVSVTLAPDLTTAFAQLTAYRRAVRRPHPDASALPVVFNDYMNTLEGDPTTERLLPLVDAAADVGAEIFCIDAGWYDDTGRWWDGVGAWEPSTTRFPGGLGEVLERIRSHGMVPGLWLEPEVVGVRSPVADRLPPEAFLQRAGQRVVENGRFHLDLRHPAARAHLDATVDRLVGELGVGYLKFDYNIDPGPGTDRDADSVGAGLLAHNRAHLAWLGSVLDRHPTLVLENCGSGAMRADPAMLALLQLQSTSDQQDPLRYPPIAAAALASMLPEQAASWAYPQPGMTPEEAAFTLCTGLAGRFYLSGHLDAMTVPELSLVREAVEVAKRLRGVLRTTVPFWPLRLPRWDDDAVALGLAAPGEAYVVVWLRGAATEVGLRLDDLVGLGRVLPDDLRVEQVFPAGLTTWPTDWDAGTRTLTLTNPSGAPGARVLRLATR